ncbi:hypothetical protein [Lactococcus petauri]|uniref:hypothetical protein n=1 Tax=Lactococcus petauri TaxID=1940789 RepID=UPI00254AFD3C|nr:hypothetical protein [Lactococcus petauri]
MTQTVKNKIEEYNEFQQSDFFAEYRKSAEFIFSQPDAKSRIVTILSASDDLSNKCDYYKNKLAIAVDALTELANDTCSVSVEDLNASDVGVSGTFAAQTLEKIGDVPEIFLRQAFAEMLEKE